MLALQYYNFEEEVSLFTALLLDEFEGLLPGTTMVKAATEYFTRAQQDLWELTDFLYPKHHPTITPVNTFRRMLGMCFGLGLDVRHCPTGLCTANERAGMLLILGSGHRCL